MVSPIYPSNMYSAAGITPYEKKSETARTRGLESRYDQAQFTCYMDQADRDMKQTVGLLSKQIRIRPTHQELDSLRQQISSGAYQANPREIAARMLLREDG